MGRVDTSVMKQDNVLQLSSFQLRQEMEHHWDVGRCGIIAKPLKTGNLIYTEPPWLPWLVECMGNRNSFLWVWHHRSKLSLGTEAGKRKWKCTWEKQATYSQSTVTLPPAVDSSKLQTVNKWQGSTIAEIVQLKPSMYLCPKEANIVIKKARNKTPQTEEQWQRKAARAYKGDLLCLWSQKQDNYKNNGCVPFLHSLQSPCVHAWKGREWDFVN